MKSSLSSTVVTEDQWSQLRRAFGDQLQSNVPLARYTAARLGGPAEGLLVVDTVPALARVVKTMWSLEIPFIVLGGGSNVLVSDAGLKGVVVLNRAKEIRVDSASATVWAASGASFGKMARKVSSLGWSGLEWATGIPGTVGGAVFGNAGAHGGEVADRLVMADILHRKRGEESWFPADLEFTYRSSVLKREGIPAVILAANFKLERKPQKEIEARIERFTARRKSTQPPGASMGSMFKNPPGNFAGRLIDAAGLKGTRLGGAEISPLHGNFFVNTGEATAMDVYRLIRLVQEKVYKSSGVLLELEIELLGEFDLSDEQ